MGALETIEDSGTAVVELGASSKFPLSTESMEVDDGRLVRTEEVVAEVFSSADVSTGVETD
jgi:hypothetical protein